MIPDPLACWSKTGRSRGRSNDMCVPARDFPLMTSNWSSPTDPPAVDSVCRSLDVSETHKSNRITAAEPQRSSQLGSAEQRGTFSLSLFRRCAQHGAFVWLCVSNQTVESFGVLSETYGTWRVRRCRGCGSGRCSSSSRSLSTRIIVIIPHHCQRLGRADWCLMSIPRIRLQPLFRTLIALSGSRFSFPWRATAPVSPPVQFDYLGSFWTTPWVGRLWQQSVFPTTSIQPRQVIGS